jgi:hypothetical protein
VRGMLERLAAITPSEAPTAKARYIRDANLMTAGECEASSAGTATARLGC